MQPDITQYRSFYDGRLGTIARRLVRARLRAMWPRVDGLTIVGLGYATPYLAPFVDTARVVACMPAEQGAVAWPRSGRNRVALADDTNLPFDDSSIDRAILIHSLETSEVWRSLLRQVWRMLRPDGRILIVAPNRRSLWSFMGETPFGDGHPYSRGQLQRRLTEAMFVPEAWDGALYGPPARWRMVMRTGRAWERLGRALYPGIPGVWLVEATKSMYAPAAGATPTANRRTRLTAAGARLTRTS
jgi:SAM-dependent methyltransferase